MKEDSSTVDDARLVVICHGCSADSAVEEVLSSAGYQLREVERPEDLQDGGASKDGPPVAALLAPAAETDIVPTLRETAELVPSARFVVLTAKEQDLPSECFAGPRHPNRVLWISGYTRSEQAIESIRRFVQGQAYFWASDIEPADSRSIFLLDSSSGPAAEDYNKAKRLRAIVRELPGWTDLVPMLEEALRRCLDVLQCEAGSVYLWDEQKENLVLRAAEGPEKDQRLGTRQGLGDGLAGWVAQAREPILVTDARKVEKLKQRTCKRYPDHSCLATPLMHGDQLLGVLCLTMRRGGRLFQPEDLLLAREVRQELGSLISPLTVLSDMQRLNDKLVQLFRQRSDLLVQKDGEVAEAYALSGDILNGIPIGVIAYDPQLRVRSLNATARDLLGREAWVGRSVPLAVRLEMEEEWPEKLRAVISNGSDFRVQRANYRSNGLSRVLDIQGAPLHDSEGTCIGGILTLQDVSDDVEMEEKLLSAERLATVGKVAAKVAHELNNPLDGILRFTNLAMRKLKENPEEAESHLRDCRQGLLRMSNTLTQLLAFSRSKKRPGRPPSITRVIRDCIALYEERMHSSNIEMSLDVPPDLPSCPIPELFEVMSNLVKNALEAMGHSGTLTVEAAPSDGTVRIRVADTGPGIPEEIREKIFEPFFSTKTDFGGTGLGLAMCRDLLGKRGGEITFETGQEGTTFEVSVPVGE